MNKAIFLDRDGVINEDKGYVHKIEDFRFLPGVFEALRHFKGLGYLLILVTNQSGIGRGYYTQEDFEKLTSWMRDILAKKGIELDGIYHCPHHPDLGCDCRKPAPGMIQKACEEHDIDPTRSWLIGDKPSDIEAAIAANIGKSIIIGECEEADYRAKTLFDTISIIKE